MRVVDELYGEFEVEDVLAHLIESAPLQRLRSIHQGGASYLVNNAWDTTRYQHSLGVMLLVRKLGGSIEEQIAGLLHDVSHTAFSHVVDYVVGNEQEDYHEKIYEQVVIRSRIPGILEEHGFDSKSLLFNEQQWTILEQPAPDLCADRIDYTLRDLLRHGELEQSEVDRFVASLKVVQGKICVNHMSLAEWFVAKYYKEVIDYFMNPLNVYAQEMLSRALKLALDSKIITFADFSGTDNRLIDKLSTSGNSRILNLLESLHNQVQVVETGFHDKYDIHQFKKIRLIDPLVIIDGDVTRVSSMSPRVKELTARAADKSAKGVFVRIDSV